MAVAFERQDVGREAVEDDRPQVVGRVGTPRRPRGAAAREVEPEGVVEGPAARPDDRERDGDDADEHDVFGTTLEDEVALAAVVSEGRNGHEPDEGHRPETVEESERDDEPGPDLGGGGDPGVQPARREPERLEPAGRPGQSALDLVEPVQHEHRPEREPDDETGDVEIGRADRGGIHQASSLVVAVRPAGTSSRRPGTTCSVNVRRKRSWSWPGP